MRGQRHPSGSSDRPQSKTLAELMCIETYEAHRSARLRVNREIRRRHECFEALCLIPAVFGFSALMAWMLYAFGSITL